MPYEDAERRDRLREFFAVTVSPSSMRRQGSISAFSRALADPRLPLALTPPPCVPQELPRLIILDRESGFVLQDAAQLAISAGHPLQGLSHAPPAYSVYAQGVDVERFQRSEGGEGGATPTSPATATSTSQSGGKASAGAGAGGIMSHFTCSG